MSQKPKILFVMPLPPPIHGSSMMCDYIRKSKKINEEYNCHYINLSTSRQIDEIGKKGITKYLRFGKTLIKTFWQLLTNKYEACYLAITCHGGGFLKDAPFVLLSKMFCKNIIIHQHNKGMSKDIHKPIFKWLLPLVYKNATVILLSWRLYPDIEKIVKKEQVKIIPNGIPETKKYPKSNNIIPRLLFLSNLIESKGVFVLLDALKILKEKGYSFECIFVGGESKEIDKNRFEHEVEIRNLNQRIAYQGKIYGIEKEKILASSDNFILPTSDECFPLVLLEAMQQSVPVISTDEGGIQDIINNKENGLISQKQNPQDLASKIKSLLDNPEFAKQLGEEGRKKFESFFTIDKWESNLSTVIQQVIKSPRGGVNVVYLGKIYGEDKNKLIASADMFVFPTYYDNECFPLVQLEAMQQVVPIISTKEGAIEDIIQSDVNGLIVNKKDPVNLAEKIAILLDNPELARKMGIMGKEIFDKHFTLEKWENKLLECLK